jgi:Ca2+-binding RTX toxin-like protein
MRFRTTVPARLAGATALAVAGAALLGAPAQAAVATVQLTGTTLSYRAAPGQLNHLTVSLQANGQYLFDDTVALTPGAGCAAVDQTSVRCTAPAGVVVNVDTGDLDDTISKTTDGASVLAGGAGNDVIKAGPARVGVVNHVLGGDGVDTLVGGPGADVLDGGPLNDTLTGGLGNDVLAGGAGVDTASYQDHTAPVTADLDGDKGDDGAPGEHDTIAADTENITGGYGDDLLTGNGAANRLAGGAGDDVLKGEGGPDRLAGDAGRDYLAGGDGDDILAGFADDDVIIGGAGTNELYGGTGFDFLTCDTPATDVYNLGLGGGTGHGCEVYTINDPTSI